MNQVFAWVLTGASNYDIEEAIRTTWPDADATQLVLAVAEQLADGATADPAIVRGWCFHATRDLYRRMVEIGDFAGAIRAVKLLKEFAK